LQRQLDLGLDAYVQIPPRTPVLVNNHDNLHGLPVNYDPRGTVRIRKEDLVGRLTQFWSKNTARWLASCTLRFVKRMTDAGVTTSPFWMTT